MPKSRVTLKEMAERLGVTVTTVSKALKDYPDIGKETKRRVRELAEELNYAPDIQALALRSNKTNTIGLILPEVVHFFFSNVIKGIMDYCEGQGYRLLITLSDNKTEQEEKQIKLFFRTKVDGVLVSLANETTNSEHFKILEEYDVPLVMFDKVMHDYDCSRVVIDDVNSAYIATKHLIDKGCKRIVHIGGPKTPSNAIQRKKGYKKALEDNGFSFDESLICYSKDVVFDEGYEFTKELLTSSNPPDGIFAVTDQVGAGALYAAQELGVNVPKDLKIVGFSDSQVSRISQPQLTTIHQSGYKIGEKAAELLIEEIEAKSKKKKVSHETIVIDTHLVERGTT